VESTSEVQSNQTGVSAGSDVSLAAAQGLRSAVSIYCTFTVKSYFGTNSAASAGSGVIYKLDAESGSAFVITNYHVVYNSSSTTENGISDDINVCLYGMESEEYAIPASYVGGSANYDIAVLRIENSSLLKSAYSYGSITEAVFSDSDRIRVGQTAIAIGNPEAQGISVTTGIVSVDSEYITMSASNGSGAVAFRVIRIDTAVNSGNSGGGLFDGEGHLIGIVNAKISASDVENIGYAIPSNVARAIADNIIDYCFEKDCETVMRGLLGISVQVAALGTEYDPETGIIYRYEKIRVAEVTAGGLGEKILKTGDIVKRIEIGGKSIQVTRQYHLIDAMLDVRVGDTVTLTVERDGESVTVEAVITEDCLAAY
jgi:serine protease Do